MQFFYLYLNLIFFCVFTQICITTKNDKIPCVRVTSYLNIFTVNAIRRIFSFCFQSLNLKTTNVIISRCIYIYSGINGNNLTTEMQLA